MAPPAPPRLRILSVGGNSVSAFLSWRLQATNACDVTLVWKSGFENVAQYGISFKSTVFGNERFKPHSVVRTPEDAARSSKQSFDYVLLCVKALPDVYDIAAIIESVVAPQHTCILINTTHSLGVESYLEQRFPTNVVLSLVSLAEVDQLGASDFEHKGLTDIWVGPANRNPSIPLSIQSDMAEALAMTLSSGQVDCKVSTNIRQQQYERMIGNIAFFPASVLFETPSCVDLLEKVGVRPLVTGTIDELLAIATAHGCSFPDGFKEKTMEEMLRHTDGNIMYNDFVARRPMEVETYLGSPLKLAQEMLVPAPRLESLYAMLHHINTVNQNRPQNQPSPSNGGPPLPPPRLSSMTGTGPRGPMKGPMPNGMRPGGNRPSMMGPPPPGMRRGPPPVNGYARMNGGGLQKAPSFEQENLEEFSHLVLYDNVPEGGIDENYMNGNASSSDLVLRERELALRQKELALREREYHMRRGGRRGVAPSQAGGYGGEDDDEDDYFDPMGGNGPSPMIDPENFDMMSVTSRRNRKAPSASQLRKNPELMTQGGHRSSRNPFARSSKPNRTSARMMSEVPGLHESIMNNPLLGYSSNRYGNVDRGAMNTESRTNSLTAARLEEMQQGGQGAYPPMSRRISQSPGNPLSPAPRNGGRPSPPNGYEYGHGPQPNRRPSPPNMRQPVPRHPPGHGNAVAPQHVEQHAGVSSLYPPKFGPNSRSLTGSASASAGSGESGNSANLGSENSAYSSQSSLGPRPPIGVR